MLEIKDLKVKISEVDKEIIQGFNLKINPGEVHAIMGPNGSGKSTLSHAICGKEGYEITGGDINLEGNSILELEAQDRAIKGIFLAFQYPLEIPGVGNLSFMRTALNSQKKARQEKELNPAEFLKLVKNKASDLSVDMEMLKRPLNVGFSGGEKKRNEILQMALLEPKLCILDETDSGLDVDAMRQVSQGVNALRSPNRSFLIITHYQRLLTHIKPDYVHIMVSGRIIKMGGPDLALQVEEKGYGHLIANQKN
ncbi:MAG: Fe-S cluster assembly ATPase SufC [Paracoccaceae bacterium]|nr:Fe-S cluster assembly ATPase SufC [Paracoccaceae bacterium]